MGFGSSCPGESTTPRSHSSLLPEDYPTISTQTPAGSFPAFHEQEAIYSIPDLTKKRVEGAGETGDVIGGDMSGRSIGNRRRSHSQSNTPRRSSGRPPPAPSSRHHHYNFSPPPENNHPSSTSGSSFHGNVQSPYPAASYDPRSSYFGQYTIPTHTTPPYTYGHTYSPDAAGMMPPQHLHHPSYQPMHYQYPNPTRDSGGSSPHPFPHTSTPPGYGHHPADHSRPHPSVIQQETITRSNSFGGQTGSFHYTPSPQYSYPPPSFTPSPTIYSSQYAPAPPSHYPQHFQSSPEQEGGSGSWWYLPSGVSSTQYDSSQQSYHFHPVNTKYYETYSQPPYAGPSQPMEPVQDPKPAQDPEPVQDPEVTMATTPASVAQPGPTPPLTVEKPVARRPYHPNPPPHRSEWVMWVGNVPSDATQDELQQFFSKPPSTQDEDTPPVEAGILSVFLISRSCCAFINFESKQQLLSAIARFHGQPLRPSDPRCPRLACRARKEEDDLKAGVGGQRGSGMHTRWVKEHKEKLKEDSTRSRSTSPSLLQRSASSSSTSDPLSQNFSTISLSSEDDGRNSDSPSTQAHRSSSGSGSYASTNSSLLSRYFPKRYFILKSLTQFDLDLSVQKGLWATQRHNEGVLDQAFRTSQDVYLIFGVNKSGEFYGYARMAGPVKHGEHQVNWASRTHSSASSRSSTSPVTGRAPPESIPEEGNNPSENFFPTPEHRLVEESPLPLPSAEGEDSNDSLSSSLPEPQQAVPSHMVVQSAPAALGHVARKLTAQTPAQRHATDRDMFLAPRQEDFELDPNAPQRAIRQKDPVSPGTDRSHGSAALLPVAEQPMSEADALQDDPSRQDASEEGWGESFKVEWLSTQKLPFHRARHIRNPWNHNREVKVSRDGTEIEPTAGAKLLEAWQSFVDSGANETAGPSSSERQTKSTPTLLQSSSKTRHRGRGGNPRS